MHRISNITGSARHGWEKVSPSMGFGSRPHNQMPISPPNKQPFTSTSTNNNASGAAAANISSAPAPGTIVNLSLNVPLASNLAGPDADDIIYASPGAFNRWTHPEGTPPDTPCHKLPIHAQNVEDLRALCRQVSEGNGSPLHATVVSSEPKPIPGLQRGPLKALVTNVCISGESDAVQKFRGRILNETPISMRCATVDIDYNLIIDAASQGVKAPVLRHLDEIAKCTKADVFILQPKQIDIESASFNGSIESTLDQRLRCSIYGDMETAEHAKTRILIMIDQILRRHVDTLRLELSLHTLICGRARKNIKHIESATDTAIYFPPPFPRIYGYTPPGAVRRGKDEVIVTGESPDKILQAKKRLHDLVVSTKVYVKDVVITASKVDEILLERLDKVRRIIENNGSYVLLPRLGEQRGMVRVQATDILNVERTVREIMSLAGQFYSASWWITHPDPSQRPPTPSDVRAMLSDICINSGAEISFEKLNFHINGSDDAVKAAMMVINGIPFVKKSQYTMRVKVELANEHKEFVSGKKNGKINKIMGHSNVQIVFDGFNEYNFYIDVRGSSYEAIKSGLDLVEQEMPASISFHVPDQYHKRIIGIGGQHIQRIMKKYSVFVKFSNAMDRGGLGKDEDDVKVDNVICRTPARNAHNLDLVKQEIMDMVEKADAEFVSENVIIDRLYHRELIARMSEIEELEKKWNCKIIFPGTEHASDTVTVSGPEYQVPQAVDELLGMVPERHELSFPASAALKDYLRSPEFYHDVSEKLKTQYVVELHMNQAPQNSPNATEPQVESILLAYTRNNAGGLKDAIDFLISRLVARGLDATTIKGAIPRPKSDSFEESLPYFDSKLLQRAEPPLGTDSPTRSQFGGSVNGAAGEEQTSGSGIFDKLRKPGSMSSFSSFLERRKNGGSAGGGGGGGGSNSPNSLFKHASSNASKASLVSIESQSSAYRNPWNDSGVNLPEEDYANNGAGPGSVGWSMHHTARLDANGGNGTLHGNGYGGPVGKFVTAASTTGNPPASMPFAHGGGSFGPVTESTPRHDPRASVDSGRPSTSHSVTGYPGLIGPPR